MTEAGASVPLVVYLGHDSESLPKAVREIAGDDVVIVSKQEVADDIGRLADVTVAFPHLTSEQIAAAANLRWLQWLGAGVDGIDLDALATAGVTVTTASGIHAETITEHAFGMLLMVLRGLREAGAAQDAREWRPEVGKDVTLLAGRTLGLLGVGAIGTHSARVGRAFGMRTVGLRRTAQSHPDLDRLYSADEALDFYAECDVLLSSAPLTPETRGMVGERELAALPEGAFVINVGRGATIDTDALIRALESGRLGGALLDVVDPEPLPAEHPLWAAPNVVITAHYSGQHPGYMDSAARVFLDNLARYVAGEPLRNVVDHAAGY